MLEIQDLTSQAACSELCTSRGGIHMAVAELISCGLHVPPPTVPDTCESVLGELWH